MNIFDWFRGLFRNMQEEEAGLQEDRLLDWLGIDRKERHAISEITYYTCMKLLAETIGKLPLKYYMQSEQGRIRAAPTEAGILMTIRPNPYMTPSTLWTTTEFNCQHYGNSYIWIQTRFQPSIYGGQYHFLGMYPMQPECVTVLVDDKGIFGQEDSLYYRYADPRTGKEYIFRQHEVMHFKTWYSKNGIMGEPVRNILKDTIGGASESQAYMDNMYKNGLTASMAMQYSGELDDERIKKLQTRFADKLSGSRAAGRVIPVPLSLKLVPLNISMADAQFFELRKYSALQIAGAFGIKPNQINDYEKSSYTNSETQQIAFLVDTMQARMKAYEEEINGKVLLPDEIAGGYFYKFNERAILRADAKTQMETLASGVNNAIYTPNEAREYLDMPAKEGGDILIANGNYIPLTMVGQQYEKKGGNEDGEN